MCAIVVAFMGRLHWGIDHACQTFSHMASFKVHRLRKAHTALGEAMLRHPILYTTQASTDMLSKCMPETGGTR